MNRSEILSHITSTGVVAVIRMKDTRRLARVIEAVRLGGVKSIEITMTVPGAVDIIRDLVKSVPNEVRIGAGTVVDRS
jgi:2-dehydro-3-deoxyphosphogluconate aldolase/(4S)-4-hydroxy-2-oxoglutarate aldolase